MRRSLFMMAGNWLRQPANQQKIKSTARKLWGKYQQRNQSSTARSDQTGTTNSTPANRQPPDQNQNRP